MDHLPQRDALSQNLAHSRCSVNPPRMEEKCMNGHAQMDKSYNLVPIGETSKGE